MKRTFLLALLATALWALSTSVLAQSQDGLRQYVEPRIGTAHCRYFHFAPGALPFGMAKPGPSTNGHYGNVDGWQATGYDYRDQSIESFPCTHEFQVGGISVMATTGRLITVPGDTTEAGIQKGYRSHFSHDDEVATAGYYSVLLRDYGIRAEMTATQRVALQRYTFPKSKESHLIFDIGHRMGESGAVKDAEVRILDDGTIEGYVVTYPEYVKAYQPGATVPIYFSASTSKRPKRWGTFHDATIHRQVREARGEGAGAYLSFATKEGEQVTVKVGISYTSVENARQNRLAEARTLTFDEAREESARQWEEMLGRIRVETDRREDKVKFYTGLYHALLGRGVCSDVSGDYPKHDGTVGHLPTKEGRPAFNLYNTDAMWGAQWGLTQLWVMAYPDHMSDYISSHLQVYKDCGWLADGLACSRFVSGVGTNQLSNMIVAAYMAGIRDFDLPLAYEACLKNELGWEDRPRGAGKADTKDFLRLGYVPHVHAADGGLYNFSASHTMEYSYSAYAVAQLARALGKEADYDRLMGLSHGWENLYDSTCNFVRPRYDDGTFVENFDPLEVWRGFQEGNAWQYTFYVPHDPQAMIAKVGTEVFNVRLDSIFTLSQRRIFSGGTEVEAFAGLRTLYNQGNEPSLHISWLFNESGRPSRTQHWVRAILNEFYGTDGIHGYGYGQDEDQGMLGAWYAVSSIGLFDVKGLDDLQPSLGLGSTIFDRVTIQLHPRYYPGGQFVIQAVDNSRHNEYVQRFSLDGTRLTTPRIPFQRFAQGGTLTVNMGSTPVDNYE